MAYRRGNTRTLHDITRPVPRHSRNATAQLVAFIDCAKDHSFSRRAFRKYLTSETRRLDHVILTIILTKQSRENVVTEGTILHHTICDHNHRSTVDQEPAQPSLIQERVVSIPVATSTKDLDGCLPVLTCRYDLPSLE
jgi:hypothetical protein